MFFACCLGFAWGQKNDFSAKTNGLFVFFVFCWVGFVFVLDQRDEGFSLVALACCRVAYKKMYIYIYYIYLTLFIFRVMLHLVLKKPGSRLEVQDRFQGAFR